MVDLKNAMICWCPADRWEEQRALCEKLGEILPLDAARVMVVEHMGADARSADYLPSSWGACCGSWQRATNAGRLSEMQTLFNRLVHRDGLSVEEVHAAFLNIEEYADKGGALGELVLVSGSGDAACTI